MKQNRIVVVAVVLLILCLCTLVICAGAYLLFGQSLDILGSAVAATWTALPLPPEATPVPATPGGSGPTAPTAPPAPTAPAGPLAPAPSSNPVPASEVPETHLLALDGEEVLHLVWGSTQKGFYHQQRPPEGDWSAPAERDRGFRHAP